MLKNLFLSLFNLFKIPLFIVGGIVALFFFIYFLFILYGFIFKHKKLKRGSRVPQRKRNFLVRLFWDLPKQKAEDFFNFDPDAFPYKGCVIFTGRQGNGKTIGMVEYCTRMMREYPKSKVITNLGFLYQNNTLDHWDKLVNYSNGKYGVICCMDETQNWFSSNQSRNFPPEMLQVITQNRKNRRIILGTAQNFYLLAKAIRSQCTEVRECITLFGCLTIVRRKEPILNAEGNVEEWKKLGMYFFVHNDELRNSYDTYKVISALSDSGFKEGADALNR